MPSTSSSSQHSAAVAGLILAGRYRLIRRLGQGGFGRVWLADDDVLNVKVAIKEVYVPPGATPEESAERVERAAMEARNAARLRDEPGIVTVHDVFVERGVSWTVMQYVPGRSLAEEIAAGGALPRARVKEIASAMLSALAACHAAGIVHRDVKPANIMMADDGQILLADFGIAKAADSAPVTAQDVVIGSLDYIAPERAKGETATSASDLFSLGVTLYHAVEGISPFNRGSGIATLSAVLLEPVPPSEKAGKRLGAVIDGLTAKDPGDRLDGTQAMRLLKAAGTTSAATATKVVTAQMPTVANAPEPTETGQASPAATSGHGDMGTRLGYICGWAALLAAGLLIPTGVGVKQSYSTLPDYLAGKAPQATSTRTSYVSLYKSFTSLGDQNYRSWAVALAIVLPALAVVIGVIMTLISAKKVLLPTVTLMSIPAVVFVALWVWLPVLLDHKGPFVSAAAAPPAIGTLPSVTPGLGLIVFSIPLVASVVHINHEVSNA